MTPGFRHCGRAPADLPWRPNIRRVSYEFARALQGADLHHDRGFGVGPRHYRRGTRPHRKCRGHLAGFRGLPEGQARRGVTRMPAAFAAAGWPRPRIRGGAQRTAAPPPRHGLCAGFRGGGGRSRNAAGGTAHPATPAPKSRNRPADDRSHREGGEGAASDARLRRRRAMGHVLPNEALIRLGAFALIFAAMAAFELWSPRLERAEMAGTLKTRRWFTNVSVLVIASLCLRVIFPAAAVGAALWAEARGYGLFRLLGVGPW